jgi:hypothetical protein
MEYSLESGSGYVLILNEGFWFGSRGEKRLQQNICKLMMFLKSSIMRQLTISKFMNVVGSVGVLYLFGNYFYR